LWQTIYRFINRSNYYFFLLFQDYYFLNYNRIEFLRTRVLTIMFLDSLVVVCSFVEVYVALQSVLNFQSIDRKLTKQFKKKIKHIIIKPILFKLTESAECIVLHSVSYCTQWIKNIKRLGLCTQHFVQAFVNQS